MQLVIRGSMAELDRASRDRVEHRFRSALSRFAARLGRVTVYLTDLNGPRGGLDKRCRVVAALKGSGPVSVENTESDLIAAVDQSADRVGQAVGRKLDRRHERRGRPSASGLPT